MAKTNVSESAVAVNPVVSIVYSPEKQLVILGHDAQTALASLKGAKITSVKTLESAGAVLHDGEAALERIVSIREQFASRVKEAFEPFKNLPLFQGAAINITLTIPLRQQIENAVRRLKDDRAQYLAAEQEKQRREQAAREAEQRRINEEAAKKAAKAAEKSGADADTVELIKTEVLATPAPLVQSKALDAAKDSGATVRYKYTAEITSLRDFLEAALKNDVLFNTLTQAVPEIEHAFDKMAASQKEAFTYKGITYKKTPIDVDRGRR